MENSLAELRPSAGKLNTYLWEARSMALAHRSPLARRPATRPFRASSAGGRPVAATHRAPTASPAGRRGRRAAGVLRGTVARRLAGGPRLGWTALGAREAVLAFISRRAAGKHGGDDDPARHRGRKALLHWQVQLAAWIHMLLPPGISCPGEHEACLSPQLTSQPPQLPLGDDFGALHLLFLPGGEGTAVCCMGGAGSAGILTPGGLGCAVRIVIRQGALPQENADGCRRGARCSQPLWPCPESQVMPYLAAVVAILGCSAVAAAISACASAITALCCLARPRP